MHRFIEEPTAPDDILGHAAIRKALKPHGIGVATGEHAHNRMVFKQLLQADAIDVVQIDSCRLAGVSEVLSVLLMAAKYVVYNSIQMSLIHVRDSGCRFGVPVCPHAGGVGLCEYVIHLRLVHWSMPYAGIPPQRLIQFDRLYCHFRHDGTQCARVCRPPP